MGTPEHWSKVCDVQKYHKIGHHWPNSIADMTMYVGYTQVCHNYWLGVVPRWVTKYLIWFIIPYNRNFSMVQNSQNMHPESSIFAFFIFTEWMRYALNTSLPVDGHTPHANRRNDTKQQSEEASLCNISLALACWTKGFSTADLNFDTLRSISYGWHFV